MNQKLEILENTFVVACEANHLPLAQWLFRSTNLGVKNA